MSKLILVVDDEPLLREIIKGYLESHKFEVIVAENGREAFGIIQQQAVDCVVSDIRMAKGSGIELAENISKLPFPRPSVILMTGYSDITDEQALSLNVLKVLLKPFDPEVIVEEVCKAIAQKPAA